MAGLLVCPKGGRTVGCSVGAVLDVAGEEISHVLHGKVGGVLDDAVGGNAVTEAKKKGGKVEKGKSKGRKGGGVFLCLTQCE